ncbi:MAG: methicillin resistance protein [Clostridiales bacterium 43-6]|nr:MAG: methicillin resistance protein [Clostridiales bacterium 43-6]
MEILKDNFEEFERFIDESSKGHFMQSKMWGPVKSEWKRECVVSRDKGGKIKGAMAVLIRKVPGIPSSIMYAPRGPVCDMHDEATILDLMEGAKALAKKHRAYELKIDPDIKTADEKFLAIAQKIGFTQKSKGKNFEGIQPRFVFRLEIKDKTEEEVLAMFHSKTRYNINLARRKGVTVKICGPEMLDDFTRIMVETGTRDNFVTRPKVYFEKMLQSFGDNVRLYMAFFEDKPVAGTLAIRFCDKVWYLYGASSNAYRNVMPNYLLQWEMIRWAIESRAAVYDFRGVSGDLDESNPLYGLYRFKKGFGGEFTEFIGELDLIFNPLVYFAVNKAKPMLGKTRKFLFQLKAGKKW